MVLQDVRMVVWKLHSEIVPERGDSGQQNLEKLTVIKRFGRVDVALTERACKHLEVTMATRTGPA